VAALIVWPNTAEHPKIVLDTTPVVSTPDVPQVSAARADVVAARAVAARFILTALARRHLAESWALATPALRQGLSRAEWSTGNIPVPTYPITRLGQARERISYTYKDDIGLDVLVVSNDESKVRSMVFSAELLAVGQGKRRHWLVDSWTPAAGTPSPPGQAAGPTTPRVSAGLGAGWLLVPLGILAMIVLVPLGLGLRGWRRNSRAMRSYTSSSRPS
jgi:hypothetical protein